MIIVAHPSRAYWAESLDFEVQADAVMVDSRSEGGKAMHLDALDMGALLGTEWVVVLEDDAVPCEGFRDELEAVLESATSSVVSLYLGTGRWAGKNRQSHEPVVRGLVGSAEATQAAFIGARELWHGVGYAIRTRCVASVVEAATKSRKPIDEAITAWCVAHSEPVLYAWPSLVDHADGPSITDHPDGRPRTERRVAWRLRGR